MNKSIDLLIESVKALAVDPHNTNLGKIQESLETCSVPEREHLFATYRHALANSLVQDTAPRLEAFTGEGCEHICSMMHLLGKVSEIDGFFEMPSIEDLAVAGAAISKTGFQTRYYPLLRTCLSNTDADELFRDITDRINTPNEETLIDEAPVIKYYFADMILMDIIKQGIPLIEGSLSAEEAFTYEAYKLTASAGPGDAALFLSVLDSSAGTPTVALPRSIVCGDTTEEIMSGIASLRHCYNTLSPACFAAQLRELIPGLRHQVIRDLVTYTRVFEPDLPPRLDYILELASHGVSDAFAVFEPEGKEPMDAAAIERFISTLDALCIAIDDEAAALMFDDIIASCDYHSDYLQVYVDMLDEHLSDYIIAAMYAEIEKSGYGLGTATVAKICLYYAIRFALSAGDIVFWDTMAYRPLMAQAGA